MPRKNKILYWEKYFDIYNPLAIKKYPASYISSKANYTTIDIYDLLKNEYYEPIFLYIPMYLSPFGNVIAPSPCILLFNHSPAY